LEVEEMLLMGIITFPGTSAATYAKKVIEIVTTDPYPEYIKRNYYTAFSGDGIKGYVVFDIEQGKEQESLLNIMNRMVKLSSIEGVNCILEPLFTAEEAFASIDMESPV
jgi:hypothetical protein